MSVPATIRELEKIEMVRRNNGKYKLDHAVTKKQKTILSSFGLDEKYIHKLASEIAKVLEDNKSLLDIDDDEEVDEYGSYEID